MSFSSSYITIVFLMSFSPTILYIVFVGFNKSSSQIIIKTQKKTASNPIPDSSSARYMELKRRHGICIAKHTFDVIGP